MYNNKMYIVYSITKKRKKDYILFYEMRTVQFNNNNNNNNNNNKTNMNGME